MSTARRTPSRPGIALVGALVLGLLAPGGALAQVPCDQNQPPIIGGFMSPASIVEDHHRYVAVHGVIPSADDDSPPWTFTVGVASSEADEGLGKGDKPNDIVQVDPANIYDFLVRAELGKNSTSRTYTFTYTITDGCGASASTSATVTVTPRR